MIKAFPKIFALGTDYIADIFKDEVEITEKVDGSQFSFGMIDGELFMRSRGQQLFVDNPEKMFSVAMDYVVSVEQLLEENVIYYCEYLKTPKHNVLAYENTPKNNLILFGVCDKTEKFKSSYDELKEHADKIDIDVVPLLFKGKIKSPEEVKDLMKKSVLGGVEMEGVVVKNYEKKFLLGGQPMALMAGKYVSEKFKEVHKTDWKSGKTHKGKYELFKQQFRTEARWEKAIQHLSEKGCLENSPRDIGGLIKEVKNDIDEEEKETIKNFLYKEFGEEILRFSVRGLPEWYKEKLLNSSFYETT